MVTPKPPPEPARYDSDTDDDCSKIVDILGEDKDCEAGHRWANHITNPRIIHVKVNQFPPGSLFDDARPISPTDVTDFPFLTMATPQYHQCHDNQADDDSACDDLDRNTVVSIKCTVRTIGISQDSARLCQLTNAATAIMSDTGANVCMAPDASKLIRVRDITPVQVDLALTPEQPQQPALCNQMGYLPMTMANGKMHDQPFLINPNASDMIMSPEAILQASSTFHRFEQL